MAAMALIQMSLRIGSAPVLANMNGMLAISWLYWAVENLTGMWLFDKMEIPHSGMYVNLAIQLGCMGLHLAGCSYEDLTLKTTKLGAKLYWGTWFFSAFFAIFYVYMRFAPETALNGYGIGKEQINTERVVWFNYGCLKAIAQAQLTVAGLLLATVVAGDRLTSFVIDRFLAFFGLISFFAWMVAVVAYQNFGFAQTAFALRAESILFLIGTALCSLPVFAIDKKIENVVIEFVGDEKDSAKLPLRR